MIQAISDALGQVLTWFGTVLTSLLQSANGSTPAGALNPLLIPFAITIAISLVMLTVRIVRKVVWGA